MDVIDHLPSDVSSQEKNVALDVQTSDENNIITDNNASNIPTVTSYEADVVPPENKIDDSTSDVSGSVENSMEVEKNHILLQKSSDLDVPQTKVPNAIPTEQTKKDEDDTKIKGSEDFKKGASDQKEVTLSRQEDSLLEGHEEDKGSYGIVVEFDDVDGAKVCPECKKGTMVRPGPCCGCCSCCDAFFSTHGALRMFMKFFCSPIYLFSFCFAYLFCRGKKTCNACGYMKGSKKKSSNKEIA